MTRSRSDKVTRSRAGKYTSHVMHLDTYVAYASLILCGKERVLLKWNVTLLKESGLVCSYCTKVQTV